MEITIRPITAADCEAVIEMMKVFYASDAVSTNGSQEIFEADVKNCISENPYLEGYVFETEKGIEGYAMVAKSFSTEFGKPCKWIEDLYIKESLRGSGAGTKFMKYIETKYPDSIFRLEVEEENTGAVRLYEKMGYTRIYYEEMAKL